MTVLPQVLASTNDDIDTVDTSLNRNLNIVHVTSYVCKDLGLQSELADSFAVPTALLASTWASQLNAVYSESVERLGNLDFGLGVKIGVGKLLALSQGRLDNLEVGDIGQEVTNWLVRVGGLGHTAVRVLRSFDAGVAGVSCFTLELGVTANLV